MCVYVQCVCVHTCIGRCLHTTYTLSPNSLIPVTTPPDSLNTDAIVGCVVGAALILTIVIVIIIIIIKVTAIICRKCGGRQVNLDITPVSGHVGNATDLNVLDISEVSEHCYGACIP